MTDPPPLRMLFWESTTRCNLACAHCRRLDTRPGDDELSTDQARKVFTDAARLGRPVVVFSGGEPLMRDDWEPLADHCASLQLPAALATNGTAIAGNAPLARRIATAGFRRVSVSLDGPDPTTHDTFRGQDGAFASAVAGIDELTAAGVDVQINVSVTTHNADTLDAMLALARDHRAVGVHFFLLVPVGCGAEIADTSQLTPDQYEQTLGWILDRRLDASLDIRATCGPHITRLAAQRGQEYPGRGCLCGRSVVFVDHRGEVYPCGYLPVSCGNATCHPLDDIWRTSPVFADLRNPDRLRGKCGRCEFRAVCGGCRARAYARTGDYLAAEPACGFQPGT